MLKLQVNCKVCFSLRASTPFGESREVSRKEMREWEARVPSRPLCSQAKFSQTTTRVKRIQAFDIYDTFRLTVWLTIARGHGLPTSLYVSRGKMGIMQLLLRYLELFLIGPEPIQMIHFCCDWLKGKVSFNNVFLARMSTNRNKENDIRRTLLLFRSRE